MHFLSKCKVSIHALTNESIVQSIKSPLGHPILGESFLDFPGGFIQDWSLFFLSLNSNAFCTTSLALTIGKNCFRILTVRLDSFPNRIIRFS